MWHWTTKYKPTFCWYPCSVAFAETSYLRLQNVKQDVSSWMTCRKQVTFTSLLLSANSICAKQVSVLMHWLSSFLPTTSSQISFRVNNSWGERNGDSEISLPDCGQQRPCITGKSDSHGHVGSYTTTVMRYNSCQAAG